MGKLKKNWGIILWAFSTGLAIAWLLEALTIGRGPVSKYLAPFAIIGIVVGGIKSTCGNKTVE